MDGVSLEQVAPAELKVHAMDGEATLYTDQNSQHKKFDGVLLPEALPEGAFTAGLKWTKLAHFTRPTHGQELTNNALAKALTNKTNFTQQEWDGFGVKTLRRDSFIKSGGHYFKPAHVLENVAGHSVFIHGGGDASERVEIQTYDAAKHRLVFSKGINFASSAAVRFEIRALIEYEVCGW